VAHVAQAAQPKGTPQLGEVHPARRPLLSANQDATPVARSSQNPPGRTVTRALAAHAGICSGGGEQSSSLPWRLRRCPSIRPVLLNELTFSFVLNNALGSPGCFRCHRRLTVGKRCPLKRLAKASASSALEKQNTTKSLSLGAGSRSTPQRNMSPARIKGAPAESGRMTTPIIDRRRTTSTQWMCTSVPAPAK
jgi:hypothetical protein